jgi:lipopolysaccharide/colanic/teichoic acid biosynthesis glycosyltransferase
VIIKNPISESSAMVMTRHHPAWKRGLDLLLTCLLLPVLVPFLGLIAIYIRCVSKGPVFFVQSRVGYGGEIFSIYKFRTMRVSWESRDEMHRRYVAQQAVTDGPISKPAYRSDLIPGGHLLRKLSLDELPQLFNVLKGNMSLVGPRPDLLQLSDYTLLQTRRFEVMPGMTGLWQVSGKNRLSFDQMIDLDLQYIAQCSLRTDLMILLKTVIVLINQHNE